MLGSYVSSASLAGCPSPRASIRCPGRPVIQTANGSSFRVAIHDCIPFPCSRSEADMVDHTLAFIQHPAIDPVALRVGPVAVRWYGLAYLAGFALA